MSDDPRYVDVPRSNDPYASVDDDRSGVEGDIKSVGGDADKPDTPRLDPANPDSTRLATENIDSTRQVENADDSARYAPDADAAFVPDPRRNPNPGIAGLSPADASRTERVTDPAFVNNESKNDGRVAPDASADVSPFVRRDDFLDRGYLSEDDAKAALGEDDAGYSIVPDGTAFRIVQDEA